MRNLILIVFMLFGFFVNAQDKVTVIHFNYKWNTTNAYEDLDRLKHTKVQYAFVEDQGDVLKRSIKSVPTIVIYKGQTPVAKFEAGLSMEILVRLDSIQAVINKYKD